MSIKNHAELAEHNFRSLEEIERYLKGMDEDVTNLGELLNQYERKFEKSKATAAATEFKISLDPTNKPRTINNKGTPMTVNRWQKVVIPKMEQLRSNFAIVDELYEKLDALHTLEGTLKSNFKARHGAGDVRQSLGEGAGMRGDGVRVWGGS